MNKVLDARVVGLNEVQFRKVTIKGKEVELIQVGLVDGDGTEFRHTLFLDGNKGPDAAIEMANLSLREYGWDGNDLPSLTTPKGRLDHIKFPAEGVSVAYRSKEYRDNKGKLHEYNEVRYIPGLGGGALSKDEVDSIAKKLGRFNGSANNTSSDVPPSESTGTVEVEELFV